MAVHTENSMSSFSAQCHFRRMITSWRLWALGGAIGGILGMLTTCGVAEDPEIAGMCSLSCAGSKVLSQGSYTVEPLYANFTRAVECSPNFAARVIPDPYVYRFKVTQARKSSSGDGEDSGGGGDGGGGEASGDPVPITGARFNVMTQGYVFHKNKEIAKTRLEASPLRGVATSDDQWCSDSCGILTVAVYLICPPVGSSVNGHLYVSSGIHAYGIQITAATEDPDDDDDDDDDNDDDDDDDDDGDDDDGDN